MKKLLTLLGAFGLTATTGAAVIGCGNKDQGDSTDKGKAALSTKIEEALKAHGTVSEDKEYAKNLEKAIDEAKTTLAKEGVTPEELKEALAKLEAEIKNFEEAKEKDPDGPKDQLTTIIAKANTALEGATDKDSDHAKALKTAIDKAQGVLNNADSKPDDYKTATADLEKALEEFEKTEGNAALEKAKADLKAKIAEANETLKTAKDANADYAKTFKTAIDNAQKVLDNDKSTKDQLVQATTDLQTAEEAFKKANDGATDPIAKAKEALTNKIEEANSAIAKVPQPKEGTKEKLDDAIKAAQDVLGKSDVTENELTKATTDLDTAIKEFDEANK